MFDKITYDIKDNYLKFGVRLLVSCGEHSDILNFNMQSRYCNYQKVIFTDNILPYMNRDSVERNTLLVNCDNTLNTRHWTWLPVNFVNWDDVFRYRDSKFHVSCGERKNRMLTDKEGGVLARFAAGQNRLEISSELSIPVRTINDLKSRGMGKLGISSNKELILWGRYNGIIR